MAIEIAPRPATLDGCFATWTEHDATAVLRSDMDMGGFTKVRLRTTAAAWLVDATVMLEGHHYAAVMQWFRQNCHMGVLPTRAKRPDGTEVVVRFTAPPVIEWLQADKRAFRLTAAFEQLPEWALLS